VMAFPASLRLCLSNLARPFYQCVPVQFALS